MKSQYGRKYFSWDQRKAEFNGEAFLITEKDQQHQILHKAHGEEFRLIKKESVNSIRAVSAVL